MQWIPTVVMLMAIVLLTGQGIVFLGHSRQKQESSNKKNSAAKEHYLFVGILNCFLAMSAFTAYFLFASGTLILSPEYGILIAQGTASWLWALATMTGVSIGIGMVLHAIRCARKLPSHRGRLLAASIVVSILTALRTRTLNPEESNAFRIRCIDLWSYFFLAWIIVILVLWFFAAVEQKQRFRRLAGASIALTFCGLLATHHSATGFVYADPWTLPLWAATTLVGVPIVVATLTWGVLGTQEQEHLIVFRLFRMVLSGLAVVSGFVTTGRWIFSAEPTWSPALPMPKPLRSWMSGQTEATCFVLWTVWASMLVFVLVLHWYLSTRKARPLGVAPAARLPLVSRIADLVRRGLDHLPDVGSPGRADDAVALIASIAMLGSIADICHSTRLDPIWDLTALIASWVILSEIVGGYPLWHAQRSVLRRIAVIESPLRVLGNRMVKRLSFVLRPIRYLFGAESKAGTIVKLAAVFVFLVTAMEIPNAGKTIIQSFTSFDVIVNNDNGNNKNATNDDIRMSKELGRLVSERVVNTIGLVGQEMRPDLLLASKGKADWLPASDDQAGDVQAAVASTTFQIPGTSISVPLGFLITPVQWPVRWLLSVRAIHGTVQKDGDSYVLLASSSTGQTWRVSWPPAEPANGSSEELCETLDHATSVVPKQRQSHQPAVSPSVSAQDQSDKAPTIVAIANLADTLAYKIIGSDARLRGLGIASSPEALPDFRAGVAQWNKFEIDNDVNALARSIRCFRRAVEKDPRFSLAHYRLGQAYLSDGQPRAAADSFRESVRTNPGFIAGHIALAETLYYFGAYYYRLPAAVSPTVRNTFYNRAARDKDQLEARTELKRVISELKPNVTAPWRAAAYLGLCRDGVESRFSSNDLSARYIAFFYCRRAEYLYSRLSSSLRRDPRFNNNELLLLYFLGRILDPYSDLEPGRGYQPPSDLWLCNRNAIYDREVGMVNMPYSTYQQGATRYYELAEARQPDDSSIRCEHAKIELTKGNTAPMIRLNSDEKAHLDMAKYLLNEAEYSDDPESMYIEALSEAQLAIDLAPYDTDARNVYSYCAWEWNWAWIRKDVAKGPNFEILNTAVLDARVATQLTEQKGLRASHAVYQSSLGEVLLASGRFDDALDTLKEIFSPERPPGAPPDAGDQAFFDEIRWDLAQAYVCASSDRGSSDARRASASEQLKVISDHEKTREDQRFSGVLELETLQRNCQTFSRAAVGAKTAPH